MKVTMKICIPTKRFICFQLILFSTIFNIVANQSDSTKIVQTHIDISQTDSVGVDFQNCVPRPLSGSLNRHIHDSPWSIKSDITAVGLFILNFGVEYRFADHLTGACSVYYSDWDYLASNRSFRTFTLRPQLRYYVWSEANFGCFFDAHFSLATYDVALSSSKWRYINRNGHPALGGGVGAGYRLTLPFGSTYRWSLEISLGVGIYSLETNRYYNSSVRELNDSVKRIWVGLDRLSISLAYNFAGKKGHSHCATWIWI